MAVPHVTCSVVQGLGYAQCPRDWHTKDAELKRATAGTLLGAVVRVVAGYDKKRDYFSRTRKSAQIYRDLEIGWAHLATTDTSTGGRKVIVRMASELPALASAVWGADFARSLADRSYVDAFSQPFLGKMTLPSDPRAQAFMNGWNLISQTAEGQQVYTDYYFGSYVKPVIDGMRNKGWGNKRTLAAGVRLRNTSQTWMNRLFSHPGTEQAAVQETLDAYAASKSHYKNDRDRIMGWPEFDGAISAWPKTSDLQWRTTVSIPGSTQAAVTTSLPAPLPGSGSGTPLLPGSGTSGGADGASTEKKRAWWPWALAAAVVVTGGTAVTALGAWMLLRKKKPKKRRKKRR